MELVSRVFIAYAENLVLLDESVVCLQKSSFIMVETHFVVLEMRNYFKYAINCMWETYNLSVPLVRWASLVAQPVKNLPAIRETWVQSLGWEDPLEKGKATHSRILAWRIPWTI